MQEEEKKILKIINIPRETRDVAYQERNVIFKRNIYRTKKKKKEFLEIRNMTADM